MYRKIFGIFLIMLGILGGFLPFMPGFIFFFAGLSMISDGFSLKLKHAIRRYTCHGKIIKFAKEVIWSVYEVFVKPNVKNKGRKKNRKNFRARKNFTKNLRKM